MKKLLLLVLVVLLGLLGAVWYRHQEPHAALHVSTTVPIIHKSDNPAFEHKRVQAVHTAILHHRPQQLL